MKLKPCPFCGGTGRIIRVSSGHRGSPTTITDAWQVRCENNCCFTPHFSDEIYHDISAGIVVNHDGIQEAVAAWNRRTE